MSTKYTMNFLGIGIKLSAKNRELLAKIRKYKMFYVFVLPAVVLVAIFSYMPLWWLTIAFQSFDLTLGIAKSPYVGLANFKDFVLGPNFLRIIVNTFAINGLTLLFGFPLTIVFALMINEIRKTSFKKTVQTITYLPHFISWVVVAGLFYALADVDTGAVNLLLSYLGLGKVPFFRDPSYFWPTIVFTAIWKELGWGSILYLAALSSIEQEQYEAAKIDGAGKLKEVFYITLPGLIPTISVMLILTTGRIVTGGGLIPDFEAIYNMGNPLLFETSETIPIHTYFQGVLSARYSYASAVGLFQSAIAFIFVFASNRMTKDVGGYGVF